MKLEDFNTRAFFGGSRVYSIPREDSDLDLVMKVSKEMLPVLALMADDVHKWSETNTSYRFGNLNIIAVTTLKEYFQWAAGRKECFDNRPVTKDEASRIHEKHRGK